MSPWQTYCALPRAKAQMTAFGMKSGINEPIGLEAFDPVGWRY